MQGALDSAATSHFTPETYIGTNHQPTTHGIKVQCANDTYMTSTATDELALSKLPLVARSCHKFADITIPLLSVYRLCEANLEVCFRRDHVQVTNPQGKTVLLGELDPQTKLYMVSMHDEMVNPPHTTQPTHRAHYTLQARANGAYTVQAAPTLTNFYHATLGYPPIQSWLRAIDKGYFVGWPGLTSERVRKYCTKKTHTSYGHQKLVKKNVKSTKPSPPPEPKPPQLTDPESPIPPRSHVHDVAVGTIPESDLQNLIATDLPGRYPITSARGHKYLFVMVDTDSGYINAVPIKSRKSSELVRAYQHCYDELKNNGLTARLMRTDNEVSVKLIEAIEADNLTLQIAAPHDHRLNPAERAIQSFKAHFIATRSGTDPTFPTNRWDLLVPMVVLTLNLLRPSKINPALSAYAQVMGVFNFNKTPIAPVGCKVIVHDTRMERGSWADHGTDGYFIGPAPRHYRNFKCWMPKTNATRLSNTVEFFPTEHKLTHMDRLDRLGIIIQQLLDLLQEPPLDHSLIPHDTTAIITTIQNMRELYGIPLAPLEPNSYGRTNSPIKSRTMNTTSPNNTLHPSPSRPTTRTTHVYHDGTIIRKRFRDGTFEGEVTQYDPRAKFYKIRYTDGDTEELTYDEVKHHRKPLQEYSNRAPRVATPIRATPTELEGGSSPIRPKRIVPSPDILNPTTGAKRNRARDLAGKKRRGRPKKKHVKPTEQNMGLRVRLHTKLAQHKLNRLNTRAYNQGITERESAFFTKHQALANDPRLHSAFVAGAIYDQNLKKWMRYNDLIKHPDKPTRERWIGSGEKEYGRLFQGFKETPGKDVLRWIYKAEVPAEKQVTYPRVTTAYRPEKEDPYRTRITAGGDRLTYDGETATHSASMTTIKTIWNSVLSDENAKFCTADCSNMYLESMLPSPQYVRFKLTQIPPRIQDEYHLHKYVDRDGYVYARIDKAWYGLKESGKIAHDDIVAHLNKHGYMKARRTEGLFKHHTRDISFTLVVDDFGIKYKEKSDVEHLIQCLEKKYTMKVDYEAKQYVGINLKWDYVKRELVCSMDGYIQDALKEFEHTSPKQHFYGPSKHDIPEYGAKVQYAILPH